MLKIKRIRYKLLISYSVVFFFSISVGSLLIYHFVRSNIKTNIERELNNSTNSILNLVRTSATVSIKNHLRAIAEKNLELVRFYHQKSIQGDLTQEQAQKAVAELILSQTIGQSGYIYCIDSDGVVKVHPKSALVETSVHDFEFVREQLRHKRGYIEYDWKNPGESMARAKALYMIYFSPWDWIISVSSYRKEFKDLVNVDDFRKSILEMRLGKSGYPFVIDGEGKAVVHPTLQGINLLKDDDLPNEFLQEMRLRKTGSLVYPWKNPDESEERMKMVIFNHLPEYEWIVASSIYLDEFYRPLETIRNLIAVTAAVMLMLFLPITSKISSSITNPLQRLMAQFEEVGKGNFTSRVAPASEDEIGRLSIYFNRFMAQLENYHWDLTNEILARRKVEEDLRESESRYRSVMEAAPDPIITYDMLGCVTYLNPAFSKVFGWTEEECLGRKMDHFVPEENWKETDIMIQDVLAGKTLSGTETRRYNKAGSIVHVSISGSTYRDRRGQLMGSVIILRDITKSKALEKQVMDIADRERQRIGQDLHDDLCPHLIGIEGLSSALTADLEEESSPYHPLSSDILTLIRQAIDKGRGLAHGLCPVYTVAHGLATALQNLADHTASVSHIDCRFTSGEAIPLKDNTVATHLFYIAREAVNNAVKHAQAETITIDLSHIKERIRMRIADDGNGMPATLPKSGIGLQIMQYRAKIIGAGFSIESGIDGGTKVQVVLSKMPPHTDRSSANGR